jgi:L-asparaginase/Glu-tRNA(Gln) amidotransferase subunit D
MEFTLFALSITLNVDSLMNLDKALSVLALEQTSNSAVLASSEWGEDTDLSVFYAYQITYKNTSNIPTFTLEEVHGIQGTTETNLEIMIFKSAEELVQYIKINDSFMLLLDFLKVPVVLKMSNKIETLKTELSIVLSMAA